MKLIELITERVEETPSGVELIANPGKHQFVSLLNKNIRRFKRGERNNDEAFVKGILDTNSNIFWIWDGFDATHAEVTEYIVNAYKAGSMGSGEGEEDLIPMIVAYTTDGKVSFWAATDWFWNHPAVVKATRNLKAKYEQQNF